MTRVWVLLVLVGCPKSAPTTDAAPIAAARPVADAIAIVRAWNAATNAHDEKKLAALYADQVELYGATMSRERATAIKKAAFAKHDRDDLGPIIVTKGRAMFEKTSRSKDGKTLMVAGYIDVDASMHITAEGDTTTDTNLARKKENDCIGAIVALVEATPEGKAAGAAYSGRGIERPDPTGNPHYWTIKFLAIGVPVELETKVTFEVYDDKPSVVADKLGPGELALNPVLASNTRAACK